MDKSIRNGTFLKDVLICSLGAYGGPEAHYGVFTNQLVMKKKYLSEEELVELVALTGLLPGPSSTQTITAIGHKIGGPKLAFLTLLVWALPAILIMTVLSFLYFFLSKLQLGGDILRFIGPMAVGFIVVAAYQIGKKVIKNKRTLFLFLFAMVVTYLYRAAFIYPVILMFGGVFYYATSKKQKSEEKIVVRPPWGYFVLFVGIALVALLLSVTVNHPYFFLFERFYRFGYLVIGGGQVVIPYMMAELVEVQSYLSIEEFLTGFGMVQGIPGPMFSFSAYAGGLATRELGAFGQIIGALISGVAIFLPGTLLIFFIYPIWNSIKQMSAIKGALVGITAVAGGLIAVAAVLLMQQSGWNIPNAIAMIVTVLLLFTKKIPAPLIVILSILFGILI